MPLITLLSDFGFTDPYVAQMKGVILSNTPGTEIVDVSHGIQKHDIAMGSYVLKTTVPLFPRGSIHVAVVDPEVGGSRLPIIVACEQGVLIGPDNGLLAEAADKLRLDAAFRIENETFARDIVSSTFHGRDIFAHAASMIARGRKPDEAGPKLASIRRLIIPEPDFSKGYLRCRVIYVDSFGNIVTNVSESDLGKFGIREGQSVRILTLRRKLQKKAVAVRTYSEIPRGKLGLLIGSQGYLELALKEANAANRLRVKPKQSLVVKVS